MPRTSRPALALLATLSVFAPAHLSAQEADAPPPEMLAEPSLDLAAPSAAESTASIPPAPPEENVGPLLLRNETREQVLDLYERWTGKTLLRPQSLPEASITLTLDKPLPKSEALRALETLLNMQGIGFTPLGDRFVKVAPLNTIRTEAPDFIEGSTLDLAPSGRIATKLFVLQFLRVGEFIPQIQQLLSPNIGAAPLTFEKSNSTLLVDSISNLQRIEQLLAIVDRPASAGLAVKAYPIANAKASEVANKVRTFLGTALAAQIGTTTTYQADDRTNQIILLSHPSEQAFFDNLIARLDTEAPPNTRSEVIFLKHANAPDVEALLAKLVSGQNTATQRESGSPGRLSNTRLNPTPPEGGDGSTPPPVPGAAAGIVADAAASEEFSSVLTIVSDERSNAIVVAGTPNDIKLVSSLVNRLDVLLAQVRIEVVIAEVNLNSGSSSGIDSLGLRVVGNKLTGFTADMAGASIAGSGANSFADIASSTSSFGYNLSGIVRISTTPLKDNAAILQTPTIVTTHNREAEIFVGETRPVISGTQTSLDGGANRNSTVNQQEIGVRLKVLPLIGSSGTVQLEIEQEVEESTRNVRIDGNDQPIIDRRKTTSFISARNGDIIVLGGLQRASQTRNTSRLGPVPFLGDLLGGRSRKKERRELIFFLRPTILTNTFLDNVEAMERIDSTPQSKAVREIVDHRPAAAPPAVPFVAPVFAAPAPAATP